MNLGQQSLSDNALHPEVRAKLQIFFDGSQRDSKRDANHRAPRGDHILILHYNGTCANQRCTYLWKKFYT